MRAHVGHYKFVLDEARAADSLGKALATQFDRNLIVPIMVAESAPADHAPT